MLSWVHFAQVQDVAIVPTGFVDGSQSVPQIYVQEVIHENELTETGRSYIPRHEQKSVASIKNL